MRSDIVCLNDKTVIFQRPVTLMTLNPERSAHVFPQERVPEASVPSGKGQRGRAVSGGDASRGFGSRREESTAFRWHAPDRQGQTKGPPRGHVPQCRARPCGHYHRHPQPGLVKPLHAYHSHIPTAWVTSVAQPFISAADGTPTVPSHKEPESKIWLADLVRHSWDWYLLDYLL